MSEAKEIRMRLISTPDKVILNGGHKAWEAFREKSSSAAAIGRGKVEAIKCLQVATWFQDIMEDYRDGSGTTLMTSAPQMVAVVYTTIRKPVK